MKNMLILLLIAFVSMLKLQEQLNLYALPQNITLTSGTFTITKQFKVNIKVIGCQTI
jgi:hexosaminidase